MLVFLIYKWSDPISVLCLLGFIWLQFQLTFKVNFVTSLLYCFPILKMLLIALYCLMSSEKYSILGHFSAQAWKTKKSTLKKILIFLNFF